MMTTTGQVGEARGKVVAMGLAGGGDNNNRATTDPAGEARGKAAATGLAGVGGNNRVAAMGLVGEAVPEQGAGNSEWVPE
jgi:hypothetical protein